MPVAKTLTLRLLPKPVEGITLLTPNFYVHYSLNSPQFLVNQSSMHHRYRKMTPLHTHTCIYILRHSMLSRNTPLLLHTLFPHFDAFTSSSVLPSSVIFFLLHFIILINNRGKNKDKIYIIKNASLMYMETLDIEQNGVILFIFLLVRVE